MDKDYITVKRSMVERLRITGTAEKVKEYTWEKVIKDGWRWVEGNPLMSKGRVIPGKYGCTLERNRGSSTTSLKGA